MSKRYTVIIMLILLSFVAAGVLIGMMPENVPMHYNMEGEVDRVGNRYENLLLPVVTAGMGLFFIGISRYVMKKGEERNGKVTAAVGIVVMIWFNLMNLYFLLQAVAYSRAEGLLLRVDAMRFAAIGLGVVIFITCNFMPKATRNAMFGLRTTWSMKNDRVWQKCQRFGGFSGMILGAVMILGAIFMSGNAAMIMLLILLFVWVFLCVYMSYRYYKEDEKANA